jgi:hypothetical protein
MRYIGRLIRSYAPLEPRTGVPGSGRWRQTPRVQQTTRPACDINHVKAIHELYYDSCTFRSILWPGCELCSV